MICTRMNQCFERIAKKKEKVKRRNILSCPSDGHDATRLRGSTCPHVAIEQICCSGVVRTTRGRVAKKTLLPR